MAAIDVLLATYNGSRFLPELLSSLGDQTHNDWRLIVRDDGSSDDTLAIIKRWAQHADVPVKIVQDGRTGLGALGNFGALLEHSDAPYFAFCDQDDVWLPEKLSLSLASIQATEEKRGSAVPVLAHTDLRVVDIELREINPSFRKFAGLPSPRPGRELHDLMIQNVVTGCAMLGNSALRQMAMPIPAEAIMHDWWLAMVAAAKGELLELPQASILYRQHGSNTLGAVKWSLWTSLRNFLTRPTSSVERIKSSIRNTQRQALAFHSHLGPELAADLNEQIRTYGTLSQQPAWKRRVLFVQKSLWARGILLNVVLLSFV